MIDFFSLQVDGLNKFDKFLEILDNSRACKINMDVSFVAESKFEANSNKYKFVWKLLKFHKRYTIRPSNFNSIKKLKKY